jgi:molybdopterin/thiamine biosynthesis adenylyltransferase
VSAVSTLSAVSAETPGDQVELRIAHPDFQRLHDHLLRDPGREEIAFLLCGRQQGPDGRAALLVREVVEAPAGALDGQSAGHVSVSQEFGRRLLLRARAAGLDVVDAHSHPGPGRARFSPLDDANEATVAAFVSRRIPGMWYGALVFTGTDVDARLWRDAPPGVAAVRIRRLVVGGAPGQAVQILRPGGGGGSTGQAEVAGAPATATAAGDGAAWAPFARQVLALGQPGQARLLGTRVAVVGAGGLGSAVVTLLAHLGVGHLTLVDPDRVERSNLNRLLGATAADAQAGRPKVEVLARYARAVRPQMDVEALPLAIDDPEAWRRVAGCDAVLAGVDDDGARVVLNRLAVQYLLPLIDLGTGITADGSGRIVEAGGQVRCVLPGAFCLQCIDGLDLAAAGRRRAPEAMRRLYRQRGYVLTEDVPAPSVVTLNAAVAAEGVNELLALYTGARPLQPYRLYDFCAGRWDSLGAGRRPGCIVCGEGGYVALGDLEPPPPATTLAVLPALPASPAAPVQAAQGR